MKHIGLFEGIGGFSLAARWMGWETLAWCEINPFCQTVLKYHFPKATGHGDIKATDFSVYGGQFDIVTGGFPCQPYSQAGKRLGKEDDRHLWPEMLRAIREIQPGWVVGENVRGLTNWNGGMVFDEVQTDLEAIGYEVLPFLLPACAVNAPHRRDRIWFVAYCEDFGREQRQNSNQRNAGQLHTHQSGRHETDGSESFGYSGLIAHAYIASAKHEIQTRRHLLTSEDESVNTYTGNERLQRRQFGKAFNEGNRWQQSSGPATELYQIGNWQQFPTQSPVCSGDDGLSSRLAGITFSKHRNESIKGYGNAIVPQVAYQIFKAIEQYESITL